MGNKRKHKDRDDSYIRRKIRRLKNQLRYEYSSDDEGHYQNRSRSPSPASDFGPLYSSDWEFGSDDEHVRSAIVSKAEAVPFTTTTSAAPVPVVCEAVPTTSSDNLTAAPAAAVRTTNTAVSVSAITAPADPAPSTSSASATVPVPLPVDILEALGDPKAKDEPLGPKIQDEISKRWGRVLVDGLSKEQRQTIQEKVLIPENFQLVKAPTLNTELATVLSESVRNRDKVLEKSQNVLGRGVAGLANLTSYLIDNDMEKVEIIKRISEVSQIFLDLHNDNTKTRRKLIVTSLDKKFTSMIADVKRDDFLFGANLGEKIKASKTAERSGLQVRRSDVGGISRKSSHYSGNWRGPPRHQGPSKPRRGGPRSRYWPQTNRRQPPAADRPVTSSKPDPRSRKPQ